MQTVSRPFSSKGRRPALPICWRTGRRAVRSTTQTRAHQATASTYGVTSKTKVASLPELAPLADQGLPNFEVGIWHGIYAPKGTPKPVLDKLVATLQTSIADPGFVQRMADLGSQVVPKDKATPEGLRKHLKAEIDKWTPIIKKAGIYAE